MERIRNRELKTPIILLVTIILLAALIWLVLALATNGRPVKKVNPKPKVSKNLATEKDGSEEKVPLIGENFETYQFNDPFKPLSISQAPDENKPLSEAVGGTTTNNSADNTAARISNRPRVLDIALKNGKKAATIKINGKTATYFEGQEVAGYTIINISISTETVEFLKGDQKFSVTATKR